MRSLSVMVITHNEANNIVACLESVKFADEIIILDSGSTDETVSLAKAYTQHVYQVDWPGFGIQKNRALEKCSCEWVLSIDADERLSPKLQLEIIALLQDSKTEDYNAYKMPRVSSYCQQIMRYGDWLNDKCIRLFRRDRGKFTDLLVHEGLIISGKIGELKGKILHNSFEDFAEVLHKINVYSTLSAEQKFKKGSKSGLLKAILHSAWTFLRGYFLRLGFLDGRHGFMLAVSNAEGCYYRYVKLMFMVSRQKDG